MGKLDELRKALRKRGAKAKISKESGLSLAGLHYIQTGQNTPNSTTRRLIATALGLPPHHFLDEQPEPEGATARRVIIELDIPPDFDLTNDRLDQIRDAMVDAGTHIINIIKKMDKQA
jgi:transcriptional regulator with XRE-family HTH domain